MNAVPLITVLAGTAGTRWRAAGASTDGVAPPPHAPRRRDRRQMPPPVRRCRGCAGTATAETAVVLPALVLLLAVSLWALGAVTAQLRCVEAARAGARAAARGESIGEVRARAGEVAGRAAHVAVAVGATSATVEVKRPVVPPWPLLARLLPTLHVSATAVTAVEPGAGTRP